MLTLELRHKMVCPHCDRPMDLVYLGVADEFRFICKDGCKAEYSVIVTIDKTTETPICGAKRVQTFGL